MATLSTAGKEAVADAFGKHYTDARVSTGAVVKADVNGSAGAGEFDTSFNSTWGTDPGASFTGAPSTALSDAQQSKLITLTAQKRYSLGLYFGTTSLTQGQLRQVVGEFCAYYSNARVNIGAVTRANLSTAVSQFDDAFIAAYDAKADAFNSPVDTELTDEQAMKLLVLTMEQRHTEFWT